MKRRTINKLLIVLWTVLLVSCGGNDNDDASNDGASNDNLEAEVLDTPTWPDGASNDDVVDGYLVFDLGKLTEEEIRETLPNGQIVQLDALEIIDQDLLEEFRGTPLSNVLESEVAFLRLGDGISLDEALGKFDDRPDVVSPIHYMGPLVHWSVYSGTPAVAVSADPWHMGDATTTHKDAPTIGIVDTGLAVDDTSVATPVGPRAEDSHHAACGGALHGTAVASAIKQVQPEAQVFSANAFPGVGPCWTTTDVHVFMATSFLLAAGHQYDAINYSLGTAAYHPAESDISYPPVLLRLMVRGLPAVAAAGNAAQEEPIYPAQFDDVAGVFAASPAGEPTVWDAAGMAVSPPLHSSGSHIAPGCALIVQGVANGSGGLDTSRVVVWAGSSFASPIYAALGGGIVDSTSPSDLYTDLLPPRMNNNASPLYPSAPTDC